MFSATFRPVNRKSPARSTIARWLRRRSRQAPPWQSLTMRLIPPRCLFCGQGADLGAVDLCSDCLAALPWVEDADRIDGVHVPFEFRDPVDEALRALKFHGDLCPARVFGALLAATIALSARRVGLPTLFVPVPLHPARLHERGFNQSAQLARQAARWLGRPLAAGLLRRSRATLPQTSLEAAARRRNVEGAFAVAPGAAGWLRRHPATAGHVALVDDVLTTGATATAAARVLREIGVHRVSIWAVARPVSSFFTPLARAD